MSLRCTPGRTGAEKAFCFQFLHLADLCTRHKAHEDKVRLSDRQPALFTNHTDEPLVGGHEGINFLGLVLWTVL